MTIRSAVFLDRDGVINKNVLDPATGEYGAPLRADQFELAPGALSALEALQQAGFALFVVSNQPNYAKGKCSFEELNAIHQRLKAELDAAGVALTAAYYCYHHPQGKIRGYSGPCGCRKPSPYFLLGAREEHGVSLESSWMVGDRPTDIECGRAAGVKTIRVAADHPASPHPDEPIADFEAHDLAQAAEIILKSR